MTSLEKCLESVVNSRRARGLERALKALETDGTEIDFSSNDYLGINHDWDVLEKSVFPAWAPPGASREPENSAGSTGSRLLTGDTSYAHALEARLSDLHNSEAALLFNSGYDLNLGLVGCLPQPNDVVLYDELCHNSLVQGLKLCRDSVTHVRFAHNDLEDLQAKLKKALERNPTGNVIVVVESVYSMDGHLAPVKELAAISRRIPNVALVVDEAHGVGVFGENGRGVCEMMGVERDVFVRVVTFGKALGVHGAVCLCTAATKRYLLNYHRPLIFSTSQSLHSLKAAARAYDFVLSAEGKRRRSAVRLLVSHFCDRVRGFKDSKASGISFVESESCIQGVVVPGNERVVRASAALASRVSSDDGKRARWRGINAMPIRSPTVPKGTERLRIILHYHNTTRDVDDLFAALERFVDSEIEAETSSL